MADRIDHPVDWVEQEMQYLVLGDKRLEERARKIIRDFSQNPSGSIPEFCGDWAATKAAYEFYKNPSAAPERLLASQRQATLHRVKAHKRILIIQDTTSFNFSQHPTTAGLGPVENEKCQGFLTHSSLAVTTEGVPLGLLAQQSWVRDENETGKRHQRHQRSIEEKESYKWLQGLSESTAALPVETQAIVVSDRESDIFEYFVHPRPQQVDLLVRASWNRALAQETGHLWSAVSNTPVQGKILVEVSRTAQQPARTAECQVQFKRVKLRPPKNRPAHQPKLAPVVLWAVLVREMNPPPGLEPLEWLLLTTLEINNFDQACELITYYTRRWLIERFHFVLKSGCALEQRQLAHGERLIRFLALANIVAWRLLWQTYLGRVEGNLPCTAVLAEYEWKALYSFIHKTALIPNQPPSLAQTTRWIAQLGGFLDRRSDGQPGVKVLWRGWRRLFDISQTWLIFNTS
ncbi:MAG: IS4 family transposase [Chloroflexi bacterium]|nr:MAG: IS4 family transposase [Chloroflexota bacterium]